MLEKEKVTPFFKWGVIRWVEQEKATDIFGCFEF